IHKGKSKAARRAIPVTERLAALLKVRQKETGSDGWIFPSPTKRGRLSESPVKKAHYRALKESGVTPFVIYDLRHTCLTRWAKYMNPFALKKLAGHESLETTMKYVHLNERQTEDHLAEVRDKLHEDLKQEVRDWNAQEPPED
ncbi:MAG: tyrosine-type recombinase/integrase, partial [Bryobacteraceae bacterium]